MTANRLPAEFVQIVALVKGPERYSVFFDDNADGRTKALRQLGKWAADPELSFSWYDAAVLSMKVRKEST